MPEHIVITTQPPVDPETPTLTHYQQLVAEFMDAFDRMTAIVPKILEAEAASAKLIRTNLNVPDVFCSTVVTAVEQLPELQAVKKLDPVVGRDKLQFIEAFRPLVDKAAGFARRLNFALMWMKASLAGDSLQVYRIAKSLASDKRSPLMQTHVDAMKRDLAKRGSTKAEREQRKAVRFHEEVEKAVAERLKEMQKAA